MIHTRSASSRAGESADSSDSTASPGRADASASRISTFESPSPRAPRAFPISPEDALSSSSNRPARSRQVGGEPGVGALAHEL
jgi:hypothetical protein